jgi:phosphomannomutase
VDLHPEPSKMPAVIQSLKEDNPTDLAGMPVQSIDRMDGTKFNFADESWLLLRASGTEPVVRVYAEASSSENVQALIDAGLGLVERV